MRKYTLIHYNPYSNKLDIKIKNAITQEWDELADNSELLSYENQEIMFSNCVEDIVKIIDNGQNSESDGLEIQFIGLDSDYELLKKTVDEINGVSEQRGDLYCRRIGRYEIADKALEIIKSSYNSIADEFSDYMPGHPRYNEFDSVIGNSIERFNETVSNEIPICIIGNYSVGKSAFINSFIGEEVLPSAENASTAKNVKLLSSKRYLIRFDYKNNDKPCMIECLVTSEGLTVTSDKADVDTEYIANCLKKCIKDDHKYEPYILHDILDYFNKSEKDDFLNRIGWNVEIEIPFTHSVLSDVDSRIVFYDTPGSNNAILDQKEHREALLKLMSEQTNALPILVCSRDSAVANDNLDIVNDLDQNNDNFTLPCCIIVFSKSDKLSIKDLSEPVPIRLRNWHGKTTIMFASPVGAIGERKKDKKNWLDGSYEEHYDAWRERSESTKRAVSLPDYNIIPCHRENLIDAHKYSTSRLYATGIPSIECEIAYFIEYYAKYKKCNRGNRDLIEALNVARNELDVQEKNYKTAKEEAEKRKKAQKQALINQLNSIPAVDIKDLFPVLQKQYSSIVDEYCASLPATAQSIYEQVKNENIDKLENEFDKKLRKDCQERLFDACFLGDNGIENSIIKYTNSKAVEFASKLQSFVEKNNTHFSVMGKQSLNEALSKNTVAIVQSEKGLLANIMDIPERINLIRFKARKRFVEIVKINDKNTIEKWLSGKVEHFEKELKGGSFLSVLGQFDKIAIIQPVNYYNEQLLNWEKNYRAFISTKLDDDNAVLSGMEEDIKRISDTVEYFSTRIKSLTKVENDLKNVLTYKPVEG